MSPEYIPCKSCLDHLTNLTKTTPLTDAQLITLRHPMRSIHVNFPTTMDDGEIRIFQGFRVQYNDVLGPTKGGLRFHEEVDLEEVTELAFLMTLKTSLAGLPFGGGKGGLIVNPKELSKAELERVSRGFMRELARFIGPEIDIPAPDVNTNSQIMAWMLDEYEQVVGHKAPAVITGKPLELGGSAGRSTSTARGAFFILEERFKDEQKESLAVAIQGFGNAGSFLAQQLSEIGFKVVAVSDSSTGLYSPEGLDIPALQSWKSERKRFAEYEKAEKITNEKLLELDVDILVPAALGDVITQSNAGGINAKLILELANGPISTEADTLLTEKGIPVIPDILANSGGVIVSYYEWYQNLHDEKWSEKQVNTKLKKQILSAYQEVIEISQQHDLDLRTASYLKAIRRIIS